MKIKINDKEYKLDGNKTYLGVIGFVLTQVAASQYWIDETIAEPMRAMFLGLAGIGLAHKVEKSKKSTDQ